MLMLALLFFVPLSGFAAPESTLKGQDTQLKELQGAADFGGTDLVTIIAGLVNVALGMLGVLFLVLLIWAGFIWMNAQGDEGKVEDAKNRILQSIIGLLIVLASYAISYFVVSSIQTAVRG